MTAIAPRARLAALVGVQLYAVALLHALGGGLSVDWGDPAGWLAATGPADAAVVALRYAGLAVGWWLLGGTGAYLLARLARLPRAATILARVTVPAVRRSVDRAVATGVAASLLFAGPAPALAEPVVPPPVATPPVLDAEPLTIATDLVVPPPLAAPPATPPAAPPAASPAAPSGNEQVHVVAAGEHLWAIAAATVAVAAGRDATDLTAAEVAPYWVRLIEANSDRLRSGDPDLIHPGERLVLPPPS